MRTTSFVALGLGLLASRALLGRARNRFAVAPAGHPSGAPKTLHTRLLEAGARALQPPAPGGFHTYVVGFHPAKDDPEQQWEAHHFCRQINEDFAECLLFDGNTPDANLVGVEYIISESLFETLPEDERRYWHPHDGEILSGQLVAPGIPERADRALMEQKMNSYGKTWHLWEPADSTLPLGGARLAWSFSREGEARPELVEKRDAAMKIDSKRRAAKRRTLQKDAHPQEGVDELKGQFDRPTRDIPGVRARRTPRPRTKKKE